MVLPVKDEASLLNASLPVALRMQPSELVLVLDKPAPETVRKLAMEWARRLHYDGLKILEVPRTSTWRFHQAYVRRQGFLQAAHDKILSFDVDDILTFHVLRGYDIVGADNVAFVTLRKVVAVNTPSRLMRTAVYTVTRHLPRRRVTLTPIGIFPGLYWLYRPYYLDLAPEQEMAQICNGDDTYLQMKVSRQQKYRHIHLDMVGGRVSRVENEDLWWRQYQLGLWLGVTRRPLWLTLVQTLLKAYPHLLRGYLAAHRLAPATAERISKLTLAELVLYMPIPRRAG